MTTPPGDPVTQPTDLTSNATESVPTFAPRFDAVEPGPAQGQDPAPRTPAPVAVGRASSGSSRILTLALGAALLVALAGVSYAVGRATAPATSPTAATAVAPDGLRDDGGRPAGVPGGFGGFEGGPTLTGTVDAVAADAITIRVEDGRTVTVGLDGTTTYHRQVDAAASDVAAGRTVQLQLTGGFGPGQGGTGTGAATNLGTAGSITIIP